MQHIQRTVKKKVCQNRDDEWGDEVRVRVMGATSDLHAAGGRYLLSLMLYKINGFMAARNVESAHSKGAFSISSEEDEGFTVISTMNSNRSRMWNFVELYASYISNGGIRGRRILISDLLNYFGNDVVVLSSSGIASIICFRKETAHILNFKNSEDDDFNMFRIASKIKSGN
ncbi:unnamed protein product [Ceutorhynchus assimilis]|uniref:Uncharacterized protein n=1 Tax=Ceutorhynchus assimilis TaxID=467358 RepID=A0A9N9MS07_9CUCU|nr:unnamed protein product [Ceutorhynchus assimilis]